MGTLKQRMLELEEQYDFSPEEEAMWDAFDDYMNTKVLEKPIEDIEEVRSYLSRHRWEYRMFIDEMSAPDGCWQELCDEEWCKRDFLRHEIFFKEGNRNVATVLTAIFDYVKNNWMDILFPDC